MESDQYIEEAIGLLEGMRPHASYFALSSKQEENEFGVVQILNEELEKRGDMPFQSFKSRGQGYDPPDCEAIDDDGRRIGIEVTELVDGAAIAAARERDFVWQDLPEVQSVVERVADIIRRKDSAKVCGGPYDQYILAIYCDDPGYLDHHVLEAIRKKQFDPARLIDRTYFLASYCPWKRSCPLIELLLTRP